MSGVGIGWGCVNGFDRTSSVADVTLKVFGWGGRGGVSVLDRTSYVVDVGFHE